jgi:hypothetical protein
MSREEFSWKVSAYDVELLYLCERAGYAIKKEVVEWRNRDEIETKGQQQDSCLVTSVVQSKLVMAA